MTVLDMDLYVAPATHHSGVFRLLSELNDRHLAIVERREIEDQDTEGDPDEVLYSVDDAVTVSMVTVDALGCWWFDEDDCDGELDCACGPVTLLEVLMHVAPMDRQPILEAHQSRLADLWDHFWSVEALLSGTTTDLGSACADCLLHPQTHMPEVYETARELSSELGEALAAFYTRVELGTLRWP